MEIKKQIFSFCLVIIFFNLCLASENGSSQQELQNFIEKTIQGKLIETVKIHSDLLDQLDLTVKQIKLKQNALQKSFDSSDNRIHSQSQELSHTQEKIDRLDQEMSRLSKIFEEIQTTTITTEPEITTTENIEEIPKIKQVILAIGGESGDNYVASVELYDPATPASGWKSVAPMPTRRAQFGAAVLGNKVYVCGGRDGGPSQTSCVSYDPVADRWNSTGVASMKFSRNMFTLTALGDDYIYAVGGNFDSGDKVERYDPAENHWQRMNDFPVKISSHSAAALGGNIYVAGGSWKDQMYYTRLFIYDPTHDSWVHWPTMREPRDLFTLIGVPAAAGGGALYAIGGHAGGNDAKNGNMGYFLDSVEKFNMTAFEWEVSGYKMAAQRAAHGVALVGCCEIYLAGGFNPRDKNYLPIEKLYTATGVWQVIGNSRMISPRYQHSVVTVEIPIHR